MTNTDLSMILPRVLIVSRHTVRKNKFVDFVLSSGFDSDYGAVQVIVPRITGVHLLLKSFEPIHGVVLCEGEDLDPSLYEDERRLHASDTAVDQVRKSLMWHAEEHCINQDIEKELHKHKSSQEVETVTNERVVHMDYDNYDGHKYVVKVVEKTPLHECYHHQGVKRLAQRFVPMAFGADGLIEWFYDPDAYNPEEGKFIMGLQFHPERMRKPNSEEFDYPGCPAAYQVNTRLLRNFSNARIMYETGRESPQSEASALEAGAEFLRSSSTLSTQQEKRMKQMGATVRDASSFLERLRMNEEREKVARNTMEKNVN
ncbi:hypothetical protein MKW92_007073 [Papaver armeniacum]|nr:hypothetical protein MKW92_007073 [Papaver armeniacum]